MKRLMIVVLLTALVAVAGNAQQIGGGAFSLDKTGMVDIRPGLTVVDSERFITSPIVRSGFSATVSRTFQSMSSPDYTYSQIADDASELLIDEFAFAPGAAAIAGTIVAFIISEMCKDMNLRECSAYYLYPFHEADHHPDGTSDHAHRHTHEHEEEDSDYHEHKDETSHWHWH